MAARDSGNNSKNSNNYGKQHSGNNTRGKVEEGLSATQRNDSQSNSSKDDDDGDDSYTSNIAADRHRNSYNCNAAKAVACCESGEGREEQRVWLAGRQAGGQTHIAHNFAYVC